MKFPAVAIAICFCSGIAMGLWPVVANRAASRGFYFGEFGCGVSPVCRGGISSVSPIRSRCHVLLARELAVLGFFAASITQQPQPKNYVLSVIESGELDLHTPPRWHGILRDEPAALSLGTSYEIELASVDYQEQSVSIQAGLRASYTRRAAELAVPELHAGDQIAIVTQPRLLQLFRDEGAFDRRAFLRSQGIELTATLRSPGLLDPSLQLLERLGQAGVPTQRTDTNGAIHILTDGKNSKFHVTWRARTSRLG